MRRFVTAHLMKALSAVLRRDSAELQALVTVPLRGRVRSGVKSSCWSFGSLLRQDDKLEAHTQALGRIEAQNAEMLRLMSQEKGVSVATLQAIC